MTLEALISNEFLVIFWHCQHKQLLLHRLGEISSLTACLKRGQRKEYNMGFAIDPNSASKIEITS